MEPLQNLERLPDAVLRDRLRSLATVERRTLAGLLRHLAEAHRRHAALTWGYPSLFFYCTEELRYSEAAAYKRITAARKAVECRVIFELIERGELHLEGILILAPHLTPENQRDVLERARGKRRSELESLAAELAPRPDRRDFVMQLPERVVCAASSPPVALTLETIASGPPAATPGRVPFAGAPIQGKNASNLERVDKLSPGRVHLGLTINADLWVRLQRVRGLLRHKHPQGRLEEVLEGMTEVFLDAKDPVRRARRRMAKHGPVMAAASKRDDQPSAPDSRFGGRPAIPRAVRDAVFLRDGGRCTFESSDGRRCQAREGLEIDHRIPRAKGGSDEPLNLRLLCRGHNQQAARQAFGRENVGPQRRGG